MAPARMAQWAYAQPPSASDRPDGSPLRSVYDAGRRQLALELLQGRPPGHFLWHCAQLLGLPDEGLLERWSTSPAHEPLHFAAGGVLCGGCGAGIGWLGTTCQATRRCRARDGVGGCRRTCLI